jgi:hypothetical protein
VELFHAAREEGHPEEVFEDRARKAYASSVRVGFEVGAVEGKQRHADPVPEKLRNGAGLALAHGHGTDLMSVFFENPFQGQSLGHVPPAFPLHDKKKPHHELRKQSVAVKDCIEMGRRVKPLDDFMHPFHDLFFKSIGTAAGAL